MNHELQNIICEVLRDIGVTDVVPDVTISGDAKHGEYTTNIAMRLAKVLKKSPMDIALQVKSSFEERISAVKHNDPDQKMSKKDQIISRSQQVDTVLQDIDHV